MARAAEAVLPCSSWSRRAAATLAAAGDVGGGLLTPIREDLDICFRPVVDVSEAAEGGVMSVAGTVATFVLLFLASMGAPVLASHTLVVDDDGAQCPSPDYTDVQAAVDAADAGSTVLVCPGTYSDTADADLNGVTIAGSPKDGLQLIANGGREEVVIDGDPAGNTATTGSGVLLQGVAGVLVQGFTVTNFHDNIRLESADGNTIRRNAPVGVSGHDGILLLDSDGNLIEGNVPVDNGTAANGCGVDLMNGSANNEVRGNVISLHDRAGIRLQGAGTGNVVSDNLVSRNGRNGILNSSTNGTLISRNVASRNLFEGAVDSDKGVGIRLLTSTGVSVERNVAFRNSFFDLFWDAAGANTFERNRCGTSSPSDLCDG